MEYAPSKHILPSAFRLQLLNIPFTLKTQPAGSVSANACFRQLSIEVLSVVDRLRE